MGKKVDLTGQRFGKLVVVGECEERSNRGLVMWSCLCDCGKQTEVRTASLRNGSTMSCGCMTTKVDLTGQRFGLWSVIGEVESRSINGSVMWDCICDCGTRKNQSSNILRTGNSKSCGCFTPYDILGKRFGKLVAKMDIGIVNNKHRYICLCDCGKQTEVIVSHLKNGTTKSCGCIHRSLVGKNHPNYKSKLTDEERLKNRYELHGKNVRKWSKQVMERDNYTCQICNQHGGNLNAHHLNGWNAFPEQRFDLDNGVTLCTDCHKEFHSQYGYGDNTREQFDEYAESKTLVLN